MKKVKFLIGAGVVAYEVYEMVKRYKEKRAFEQVVLEIEPLEEKLAFSRESKFLVRRGDSSERRRYFRR